MENFLILIILVPWVLFMFIGYYANTEKNKEDKKQIIIKMIITIGILFFNLPEEYSNYVFLFLVIIMLIYWKTSK